MGVSSVSQNALIIRLQLIECGKLQGPVVEVNENHIGILRIDIPVPDVLVVTKHGFVAELPEPNLMAAP